MNQKGVVMLEMVMGGLVCVGMMALLIFQIQSWEEKIKNIQEKREVYDGLRVD